MSVHSVNASPAQQSRQIILWGMAINVVLAGAKIGAAILGHSHALLADGLESTLDIFSSLLMWVALKVAEKPPDAEHPYGHGKVESLAGIFGALLLIFSGAIIAGTSVHQILHPSPDRPLPAPFTLVVLVAVVFIKSFITHSAFRKNRTVNSSALGADAYHHRADALTSLAAFIGICLSLLGGPQWRGADDWAALFSCAIIVFNGVNILRGSLGEILDVRVSKELVDRILELAESVPGVSSAEKCRVRKSGLILIADLHVRVDGNLSVHKGHQIAHDVIRRLLTAELKLQDITVHLEPD